MIGFLSKALSALILGRDVMARRSMPTSFGPLLSSRFLTLGRKGIQVGAVVLGMTVVLVRETVDAMTVVTQDEMTGAVAVTVIQDVVDEMTGEVIEVEAGTLVGEVPDRMMTSRSK
jgi:hypothetical protein